MTRLPVRNEQWVQHPEMMGHIYATKMVNSVENLFNKYTNHKQQTLLKFCFDFNNTDWHYWINLTQKYINIVQYVVRRINKQSWNTLLYYCNQKEGLLKSKLTHYLEIQAFKFDQSAYFKDYKYNFSFYGMSDEDIRIRFFKYHNNVINKYEH